ncbi:OmpA family protein [Flavobacteriaceae bacterium R38]|nr:OmpA family protein [Flavobacteriaceae bacterium R38]
MKKTILLLYITLSIAQIGLSQERKISRGGKNYDNLAFIKAIDIYERVAEKGYKSADIFKKLGNSYYFNANYENAAKWYKELIKLKDETTEPEYYFRYAQSLKALKNYGEADQMMQSFYDAKKSDNRAQLFDEQREYLEVIKFQSGRYRIEPFPLNSEYSDFAPSFYQKNLVFSSARDTGTFSRYKHSWNDQPFLDLYGTPLDENSIGASKFSKTLNTRYHESTTAFTKDGSTVYFTRSNYSNGKYRKDSKGINKLKIYRATINNGEWQNVTELPFNGDEFSTAHPALNPEETKLYFASDREGSLGLSDIYVVDINNDGSFSEPKNLGPDVNTEGRETFPFVSTEGNLYLSSDGHPGLGGLDVFAYKLNGASSGKIFNVGEPINSSEDDFTFIIDDTTKEGYFASNRDGGKGNDDIYILVETSPLKEKCDRSVTGVVTDKYTKLPIAEAEVIVIDENNKVVTSVFTDGSGNYKVSIDCTQGQFIRVQKRGYLTKESFVDATFKEEDLVLNFELELDTITAGIGDDLTKILGLKPIYFDLNKSKIRGDAEIELAKVIAVMEHYPNLKIDVRSHTDSRANDRYNLKLSERRAKSTIAFIVKNGIDASRITGRGYGETQLINTCENGVKCSEEEHELNRRSEFVIVQ